MSVTTAGHARGGFSLAQYATCLNGIVWREALRFLHQRERFVSALVRPLVWLFIFAVGFRQVLGVSIIPPYETYILYEVYIAPGLMAMKAELGSVLSTPRRSVPVRILVCPV